MRQHAIVPLERQRIVPDEELLVALEAEHPIARTVADESGVGRDAHDGGVEVQSRPGIPARVERRLEWQAVVGDPDRGNPVFESGRRGFRGACAHR